MLLVAVAKITASLHRPKHKIYIRPSWWFVTNQYALRNKVYFSLLLGWFHQGYIFCMHLVRIFHLEM